MTLWQRLMSRIRELEHRLFDPEGSMGVGRLVAVFLIKSLRTIAGVGA